MKTFAQTIQVPLQEKVFVKKLREKFFDRGITSSDGMKQQGTSLRYDTGSQSVNYQYTDNPFNFQTSVTGGKFSGIIEIDLLRSYQKADEQNLMTEFYEYEIKGNINRNISKFVIVFSAILILLGFVTHMITAIIGIILLIFVSSKLNKIQPDIEATINSVINSFDNK